jgi:hypothetical protein
MRMTSEPEKIWVPPVTEEALSVAGSYSTGADSPVIAASET